MAVAPIFPVLLIAVVTRCKCDHANGFNTHSGNSASQFGALLKPPPPPPLPPIAPVPFHGGSESQRLQRQNSDVGYQYQTPPPPQPSSEFKFPAPFYKQYNFNFVPPPQPFSTTPSPSLFQKVSGWLFPSQQTSYAGSNIYSNIAPVKKDCNPCNLVPWLPVIRYNLGAKNIHQNSLPTYGPPSPTAYATLLKPQTFNSQNHEIRPPQLTPGVPHVNYGPPSFSNNNDPIRVVSSTYGPPSATHTLDVISPNPPSATYSQPTSSYGIPSSSFVLPSNTLDSQFLTTPSQGIFNNLYNRPSSTYKTPSSSYGNPTPSYESPSSSYGTPPPSYGTPSPSYGTPSTSYGTPSPSYGTPSPSYNTNFQPVTPQYEPGTLNKELPPQSDVELLDFKTPKSELQLPKVSHPTSFKNSYGEPITNTHIFDISYPVSATAAESSKVKTHVLPHDSIKPSKPNTSFALANPAPFTLNRGRNIHTLQPVALPNLSVSPLPPIFNARPFRPMPPQFPSNILQGINQMQQTNSNVHVEQSIPLAEFTHSVDYPATIIQSPIIEIEPPSNVNHTKAFRNIPNSYVVDEIRDISSQASEDHISATKSIPDASFESTGTDIGNELYDNSVPADLKPLSRLPPNHKPNFADLRGINDDDVDKYRTESNLQNIDSPLLYLKPSAPHKNHGDFILAISSPIPENEYEIYDDITTTAAPQTTSWDESKTDYKEEQSAYKPKIVQIIVPYTTGNKQVDTNEDIVEMSQDWPSTPKAEYQARKVPSNMNNSHLRPISENYNTAATTTVDTTIIENYDSDSLNPTGTLRDFYDVKEPPFDIIRLQHTIDDWTEQEYSKQYKTPQRTRSSEKYAKQIPDDYFTTTIPTNYVTTTSNYNYEIYDHEGSSSIQHTVTDESNNTLIRPRKEYNTIERTKNRHNSGKNEDSGEVQKLHIYTAASSFRTSSTSTSTTTTPAPWGKIQTSISPLTKEKVYVVTSKPWRDLRNVSTEWYEVEPFESKKTSADNEYSATSSFPFKSPRFMNRPSFGFTSGGKIESDSSFGFSKSWYQSINELETQEENKSTSFPEASQQKVTTNLDEDNIATTAKPHNG